MTKKKKKKKKKLIINYYNIIYSILTFITNY